MPWSRASIKDFAVPPKCWRIPAPPLAASGGRLRNPEELRAELKCSFYSAERLQIEAELEHVRAELIVMLAEQECSIEAEPSF